MKFSIKDFSSKYDQIRNDHCHILLHSLKSYFFQLVVETNGIDKNHQHKMMIEKLVVAQNRQAMLKSSILVVHFRFSRLLPVEYQTF